ncbi:TPA: MerR family DNA-binding transcriptional regulator [Enterococcus faecalis]|nr:MerR family DNA-binding transcriptional regulator [Enterococcus faecalis]
MNVNSRNAKLFDGGNSMEKNYTIKDVSELLNIPKSTIRYWDEQGLISTTRNEENGYRTFDLEDLFKIYDIDFYRKMGIPIKDMLNLYKKTPTDLYAAMEATEEQLGQEIKRLQHKYKEIKKRKLHLHALIDLETLVFSDEPIPFDKIVVVDIEDPEEMKVYMEHISTLGIYGDLSESNELTYGICLANHVNKKSLDKVIWLKESSSQYKGFILKVNTQDTRLNNIEEVKKRLAKQGFETGIVVGEHILTQLEEENQYIEYYYGWIEILGEK